MTSSRIPTQEPPKGPVRFLALFFATGFGLGYLPMAPGTWGSLLGIPVHLALSPAGLPVKMGGLTLLGLLAVWSASLAGRSFQKTDAPQIVIDEIMGMAVALAGLPTSPAVIFAAFVLFRGLDILKPFPIRQIEEIVPGGWGVVADDLAAGILANILLRVAQIFI